MDKITLLVAASQYSVYGSNDLDVIIVALKGIISVAVPVAIAILSYLLGAGYVPEIIKRFKNGGIDTSGGDGYDTDYWSAADIAIFEAYDRGEIDSYIIDENGVHPL